MDEKTKKIVYLFGAGATDAELSLEYDLTKKPGTNTSRPIKLTSTPVSRRVISRLKREKPELIEKYNIDLDPLSEIEVEKDVDVELLISAIETLETKDARTDAQTLRVYFSDDIKGGLALGTNYVQPRLLPALLELHSKENILATEEVLGHLSLNYDDVFERALSKLEKKADFGIHIENNNLHDQKEKPFLKLHGSFDWHVNSKNPHLIIDPTQPVLETQWIPPQLNKEYDTYPYNLLQGKAEELLRECDVLRIIGCSLSQNDLRLLFLLFETQKSRLPSQFVIEYVGSVDGWERLYKRLGILLKIEKHFTTSEEWAVLRKENLTPNANPFLEWLYLKSSLANQEEIAETVYLKDVTNWATL